MPTEKNRWGIAASAVGIHLSIGSVYAYSVWKLPLEEALGWSRTEIAFAFSLAILFLGLSAAFLGHFVERRGPRQGALLAACCFAAGLFGAGAAVYAGSLIGFYLGYGVISGIGLGVGYVSPVSTLVKWFPDRR
ncbi:MAG: MFS transporter, partial [Planctomycetota bacterium]